MAPKELITQGGTKGRSWQVFVEIIQNNGMMGHYVGYSATLLRNLPTGFLSYSSFKYLKVLVLQETKQSYLELMQSVQGNGVIKVVAVMYDGVSATMKRILKEEGQVGLTRVMGPRVLHNACFLALGYFAFETTRHLILREYLRRKELGERGTQVSISAG
ncbi:protein MITOFERRINLIKE 1, chloroplastic-like [Glycine max]|uniref:protein MITOFERRINLIKE 1, chloroplastic-like n=1 Tax=Glycine max TaxID=3847 RepID=UPI0003DEBB92|nr:protein MITOFERRINLIKE 1, chloroplastic-like [Glycine max]|eukprot:XP_006582659.1 protein MITOFERRINLIKE 1, chloroplastic-like [Glycine max]